MKKNLNQLCSSSFTPNFFTAAPSKFNVISSRLWQGLLKPRLSWPTAASRPSETLRTLSIPERFGKEVTIWGVTWSCLEILHCWSHSSNHFEQRMGAVQHGILHMGKHLFGYYSYLRDWQHYLQWYTSIHAAWDTLGELE